MAGIERFERKVGIEAGSRSVDFSAPRVADVGQEMRGLGRATLAFADPIMRDKAQKRGLADAGSAPIVKDEQGRYKRAEPLPGGGLAYREAFNQAASQLYRGRVMEDAELTFGEIAIEERENPQRAFARMDAHRKVVLETTPPDIRAEIEQGLSREMLQRFNGLAASKADRDNREMVAQLTNQFETKVAAYLERSNVLKEMGAWGELDELTTEFEQDIQRNQDSRAKLGGYGVMAEENEDLAVETRTLGVQVEVHSIKGMQAILGKAPSFAGNRSDLEMLAQWADADPTGGEGKTSFGLTREDYVKQVPSERVRKTVANWANGALSDLNRLEAERDGAAREKAQQETMGKILAAFSRGTMGAAGEPLVREDIEKRTTELIVGNGGNVTQWMLYGDGKNPNAGVEHLMGVVKEFGYLPKAYHTFLTTQASATNAGRVGEVLLGLQTIRGRMGERPGLEILRKLPPGVVANSEYIRDLVSGGMPMATAQKLLEKKLFDKLPNGRQLNNYFLDDEGKPSRKVYYEKRDKALLAAHPNLSVVQRSTLTDKIDSLIPSYLGLYGEGGVDKALEKAASNVLLVWAPHPLGLNGILPAELVGLKMNYQELDLAVGNYVGGAGAAKGSFPHGGAFGLKIKSGPMAGQPRARIEIANDDTPIAAGLGSYNIFYYDEAGNPAGERTVILDQGVKRVMRVKEDFDAMLRRSQVEAARANRAAGSKAKTRANQISDRGPKY